jgi:hypothetical protein
LSTLVPNLGSFGDVLRGHLIRNRHDY